MCQPDNRDQVLVVGNNGRFTGRFEADESIGVHIGDFRCRAVVIGQWSHISRGLIRICHTDGHLLGRGCFMQNTIFRQNLELDGL